MKMPRARGIADLFGFFSTANIAVIVSFSLVVGIVTIYSIPILYKEGASYIVTSVWKPVSESYGIAFAIGGTIVAASIAILIALAAATASSIVIVEIAPQRLRGVLEILTDVSASIPTVVYGLWGLSFLAPALKQAIMDPVSSWTGLLGRPSGTGASLFTASILLAIMIYPFATAIIREGFKRIPRETREALYSLGLTRWEVVEQELKILRPTVVAGLMVAFGRAVGETVAVSMVVGNVLNPLFYAIFSPGYTISSLIADQFPNAEAYRLMPSAIFGGALVLFSIGFVVNIAATRIAGMGSHGG